MQIQTEQSSPVRVKNCPDTPHIPFTKEKFQLDPSDIIAETLKWNSSIYSMPSRTLDVTNLASITNSDGKYCPFTSSLDEKFLLRNGRMWIVICKAFQSFSGACTSFRECKSFSDTAGHTVSLFLEFHITFECIFTSSSKIRIPSPRGGCSGIVSISLQCCQLLYSSGQYQGVRQYSLL